MLTKISSQCPTWWSLTALHHHFESQPLPTFLARYAHFLPDQAKHLLVAQTYVIEV